MKYTTVLGAVALVFGTTAHADLLCKSYGDFENGQEVRVSENRGTFIEVVIGGKVPTDLGEQQVSSDAVSGSQTYQFARLGSSGLILIVWRNVPIQTAVSDMTLHGFKGVVTYTVQEQDPATHAKSDRRQEVDYVCGDVN